MTKNEKSSGTPYACPSNAEWAMERRAMETLDSSLTGRRIIVADVDFLHKMELGYTAQGSVIHVARDHAYYRDFTKEEAAVFRFGVNVHEAMHQVYTDFDAFHQALSGILDQQEQEMFAQIFNLIEDPAIENFADQAVGGFALDSLYYMIEKVYEAAQPVSGPQNNGRALDEYIDALIQFGDRGIVKGGFSSDKAREYFNRTAPIIYQAINEPDGAARVKLALDVYNIAKSLWAGRPKSQAKEMLQSVARRYGKSATDGSGKGKSPRQDTDDARNDRRKQEIDEQKEKEKDALMQDAGYGEGEDGDGQDQSQDSGSQENDGQGVQNDTSDTGKDNESGDDGKGAGTGNAADDEEGDDPGDGKGRGGGKGEDDADDASDDGGSNGNGEEGSDEKENGEDGTGSGSDDGDGTGDEPEDRDTQGGNDENHLSAENQDGDTAGEGGSSAGNSESAQDPDGQSSGSQSSSGEMADSKNPQNPGDRDDNSDDGSDGDDGDEPVFRYDPDIVEKFAEAMQRFVEQQTAASRQDESGEPEAPESFARQIATENRQFDKVTEQNAVAQPEGLEGAYADILGQAAWIIGPLTNQLKKIFADDRGGKAYTQRGKVSLKRAASGRVTTRMFERRIMPGDKADMCLMLLIDLSGSMSGVKEQAAKLTAIVLSETFACFGTPVYCMGFQHVHGADAYQTHFVRWRNTPAERISILAGHPSGNNFDAYSIRYATQLLQRRTEKHKLMCVISDGLPSHYFCGDKGVAENARAIQDARLAGIDVFGMAIAALETEQFLQMYGKEYFIRISRAQDLADQTAGLIKTVVKDW